MVRTIGFEREFFVRKGEEFVLAGKLPADACGYLAESRGEFAKTPIDAAFNLEASDYKLGKLALKEALTIEALDSTKLPTKLYREALRQFGKGPQLTVRSLYGRWLPHHLQFAGLHVHFGSRREIRDNDNKIIASVTELIDIPRIVVALDKHFAAQIKAAKRVPGLYELKPHGFEYRSLPTSLRALEVAEFLKEIWSDL